MGLDAMLEKGSLPDWLIRIGIRRLLKQRIQEEARGGLEAQGRGLAENDRGIEEQSHRHRNEGGERAALRSADALLPIVPRQTLEI